jgi:uncharacterized protein
MIVWDERKRRENIAKHGLDFSDLTADFFIRASVAPSRLGRFVAVGRLGSVVVVAVVFRPLGSQALSVISMRPASRKERTLL